MQLETVLLTLAKEMASHPIILGIEAIINDCNIQTTTQKTSKITYHHNHPFIRMSSKLTNIAKK